MNDVAFPVARVLDGIAAAQAAGLGPVKVNMVVQRGVNEDSIVPMARYFHGTGCILRFIEFMDVGATNGWQLADVIPAAEIVRRIGAGTAPGTRSPRTTPARSPAASATPTAAARSASSPPSPSPSAATAPAPACPPRAACTPACSRREGFDLRALLRGEASDAEIADKVRGHLDCPDGPLLGGADGGDGPAAQSGDVAHRGG